MIEAFHRPSSVTAAVALKAQLGEGAFYLGGGTALNALGGPWHPRHLVSLAGLDLGGARMDREVLEAGATATLQELLGIPGLPDAMVEALAQEAVRNVRNQSTLGGRLAAPRPGSGLAALFVALGARLEVADAVGGREEIPLSQWLASSPETGLVTAIRVPRSTPPRRLAFGRLARSSIDLPVATVAVALGGTPPTVVVGAVHPAPVRMAGLEQALGAGTLDPEVVERFVADEVAPTSDLRGEAGWKRQAVAALVARTVEKARAGQGGTW